MARPPALRRDADGRAYVRVSPRMADLIAGETDLSQWTDEEVVRGQARSKRGMFEGRPPSVVPRALYEEFVRRQLEKGFSQLMADLPELVAVMLDLAKDETLDPALRLRAADMALDRVLGKPRERHDIDLGIAPAPERPSYEQVLNAVVIRRGADEWDGHVVDAEVVDDDPWDTLDEWDD